MLSYNQAKYSACIALLDPIIALSGHIIPVLQIKKLEAGVRQGLVKGLLYLGFKLMYSSLFESRACELNITSP